jgi:hypothetical protein
VEIGRQTDIASALRAAGATVDETGPISVRLTFSRPPSAGAWIGVLISYALVPLFAMVVYYAVRNAVQEGLRRDRASRDAAR